MKNVKQNLWLVATLVIFMGMTSEVEAQESNFIKATPEEVKWGPAPPFLPEGAQFALIEGDPGQEGPFTIRLRFPAGYEIPAHKHPSYEHITVLSGTLNMSTGEHLDQDSGVELPVGSFAYGPEEQHHAAWTTDEGAVIQIQSQGPFEIQFLTLPTIREIINKPWKRPNNKVPFSDFENSFF